LTHIKFSSDPSKKGNEYNAWVEPHGIYSLSMDVSQVYGGEDGLSFYRGDTANDGDCDIFATKVVAIVRDTEKPTVVKLFEDVTWLDRQIEGSEEEPECPFIGTLTLEWGDDEAE
jgi:hypothetical protein